MAQLGAGAGTGFPLVIDTAQIWQNGINQIADSLTRIDAEMANDFAACLLAIEQELGADPSSTFGSVRARLDLMQAIIDTVMATSTGSLTLGHLEGRTITTVNASSGAGTPGIVVTNAVPAGVVCHSITSRVIVTCGNSLGLTTWSFGDSEEMDRWGGGNARTAGTVTAMQQWRNYRPEALVIPKTLVLTADTGQWDPTGQIKITAHWSTYTPEL